MGYEVHITRKATGWDDARDPAAISLAEWLAYVADDPEMQLDDYPAGDALLADVPLGQQAAGQCVWLPYSKNGLAGRHARFAHHTDRVTVQSPDEEILAKMLAVAQALGARVQGDDGEYFDEDPAYTTPGPAAAPLARESADFRDFQTFASAEAAQPLLAALARHHILAQTAVDDGQPAFDPSFANNRLLTKFIVKLRLADFERASQLLDALNEHALSLADPDHYLFKFTDEELFDLLVKPDEWSSLDVTLAGQLLRQRGRDVSADTLRLLRQHRVAELAQPERDHEAWIRGGYLSALLGGFFGILIGYQLYFHRRQLPDGRRVYAYTARDRVHGLRILVLGVVMLVLVGGARLLRAFGDD